MMEQIISVKEMKKTKHKMFTRFVLSIAAVFVVLAFTAWLSFKWVADNALDKAVNGTVINLASVHSLQRNDLNFLKNIVFQFKSDSALQRYVMNRNELSKSFILENWISVAEQVKWISQIRFISNSGFEMLRVEYDPQRGFAERSASLQDKSNRDYFLQTKMLKQDELYISPISLNREYNEFSYPLTPVIRFGMQVFHPSGQPAGVLVVNYLADELLGVVNEVLNNAQGSTLVLDNKGNYLQGYEQQQNWSHELTPEIKQNFSTTFPSVWAEMQQAEFGTLNSGDEWFVFHALSDDEYAAQPNRYLIIQNIANADVKADYGPQYTNLYILFPALFLLAFFGLLSRMKEHLAQELEHNSLELVSSLFFAKEAICIADNNWRVVAVNPAFSNSTGYSYKEVEGKSCDQLDFITNTENLAAITQAIVSSGSWVGETAHTRSDESKGTYLISASSTQASDGSTAHYVLHMTDISDRKEMENELKIAAAAFHTRTAITITDKDGNIIRVNDAFTEITGYSKEEVIGQNPRILSSGKHDQAFYKKLWQDVIDTGSWQGEIWNRHKNGKIYPEWIKISAISADHGQVTYYVATFEDTSERKRLEAQVAALSGGDE